MIELYIYSISNYSTQHASSDTKTPLTEYRSVQCFVELIKSCSLLDHCDVISSPTTCPSKRTWYRLNSDVCISGRDQRKSNLSLGTKHDISNMYAYNCLKQLDKSDIEPVNHDALSTKTFSSKSSNSFHGPR